MAGAYTLSMASNYNLTRRPAVVLVNQGASRLIQRRETYTDLLRRDLPLHSATGTDTPGTAARFWKYHALGNDYIVLDPRDWPAPPTPAQIRRICDRHRGVGSDGILWGPYTAGDATPDRAGFYVRLFYPDGGEFEKSGNGLRIFARYLWDRGAAVRPRLRHLHAGGAGYGPCARGGRLRYRDGDGASLFRQPGDPRRGAGARGDRKKLLRSMVAPYASPR